MRRGDPYQMRQPPSSSGFFYSRTSGAPSPSYSHSSYSHRSHPEMPPPPQPRPRRGGPTVPIDEMTPSYFVEHLATFAVGRQFGLVDANDGIRKLKQMEKNQAIWAQPLILRLSDRVVTVEDENGDIVEEFPLDYIEQPTAHVSSDPRDTYNNILLFIVRGDNRRRSGAAHPTEIHIFQCNRVAATEVADDLQAYVRGQFNRVRKGRRSSGQDIYQAQQIGNPQFGGDDASINSEAEIFERDVNTLNLCFDDIERFVSRIQSAASAQRELEHQAHRYRTANRKDKKALPPHPDPNGILQMRAQMPLESDFVDIFRKFKLCFNLLAKLKNHIHDPNAPDLLHFLFTPLSVILEACHWGLGRNIAPNVVAPLLSLEARELLQNCLTSKESDIWMSLGETWRTPPEDWNGQLPPPYRPVFLNGFAPYGVPEQSRPSYPQPIHRGESAPPAQFRQPPPPQGRDFRDRSGMDTAPNTPMTGRHRQPMQRNLSVDQLDLDRLSLERERMDFEKAKMMERERRLLDEERKLRDERARVEAERNMLKQETLNNNRPQTRPTYDAPPSSQASPAPVQRQFQPAPRPVLPDVEAQSPRQRAFVDDILARGGKLVRATFDRVAQNPKELTVSRGEFLEVMDDRKNWWECRNVHQRVGYVPHTILSLVPLEESRDLYGHVARGSERQQLNGVSSQSHPSPTVPVEKPKVFSDAGVQANVHQVIHQPPPPQPQPQQIYSPQPIYQPQVSPAQYQPVYVQPPPPPIAPPPPTQSMLEMLNEQRSNQRKVDMEPPRREPKVQMQITKRSEEEQRLINQLNTTVNNNVNDILRSNKSRPSTIQIHEQSNPQEVAYWLEDKGFSYRVLQLFEGQDGAALFSLNKNHLIQACGRDEGSRLYSQILVQKNRSNYKTHTNAELKAILHQRKTHVEVTNTAPDDEPSLAVLS